MNWLATSGWKSVRDSYIVDSQVMVSWERAWQWLVSCLKSASKVLSFIPIFTRTSFIALNINLLRPSLDATISVSVSVFIRLNPRATPGLFQLMYLLTLPPLGVIVIIPNLSTLRWCPLKVIVKKQSTNLTTEPCKPQELNLANLKNSTLRTFMLFFN